MPRGRLCKGISVLISNSESYHLLNIQHGNLLTYKAILFKTTVWAEKRIYITETFKASHPVFCDTIHSYMSFGFSQTVQTNASVRFHE